MSRIEKRWLFGVFGLLTLLAAACGGSDDDAPGQESDVTVTSVVGDSGAGDPDTSEPQTSEGGGEADSSSGMSVNGGLTVSEALSTDAEGVLAVRGHLYDEGTGAGLCESLTGGGERYTCGGALLPVEGLDLEPIQDVVIVHDGLTYTEEEITVLGAIVDGTLVVDPTVS